MQNFKKSNSTLDSDLEFQGVFDFTMDFTVDFKVISSSFFLLLWKYVFFVAETKNS